MRTLLHLLSCYKNSKRHKHNLRGQFKQALIAIFRSFAAERLRSLAAERLRSFAARLLRSFAS
jgi:hypothetical protein